MKLSLDRADTFNADFDQQHRWCLEEAGEELAGCFVVAVEHTLKFLSIQPALGNQRRFRRPALVGIRSFRVEPPFQKILIFYRLTASELSAERRMHGSRDLPRRLARPLP